MILVTGGTGLVGSHLLYFLLREKKQVRALHRKDSNKEEIKKVFTLYTSEVDFLYNKLEWFEADITDIPSLSAAFENVTHVYHCAAFISFDPSQYKTLKKVNVEGTANIVNLCIANNVEKLCYVSSTATLGSESTNRFITEKTPWNPDEKNSVYAITKYGAEMEVWRSTQEGLPAVIVNPGVILGNSPSDRSSGVLISLGSSGIPFYPSGSMGFVDVQDVVNAMQLLMESSIVNEQYILVSENITYKQLLTKVAILFGKKPPTKKLPKGIMYFISSLDWLSHKLFRTRRKVVKATVRSMFRTSYYNNSKITEGLSFTFKPINETLERVTKETKKLN